MNLNIGFNSGSSDEAYNPEQGFSDDRTDADKHLADTEAHIQEEDRVKWDTASENIDIHKDDAEIHITQLEKETVAIIKTDGDGSNVLGDDGNYHDTDLSISDSDVKLKYERNEDTNAFTDNLKQKLENTNENAEVNPSDTDNIPEGTSNLYYTEERVSDNTTVQENTNSRHTHDKPSVLEAILDPGSGNIITDDERNKLDNIQDNAEVNPTSADIKTQYESNADTNTFSDDEKLKLSNIQEGAQENPTSGNIKTSYESNPDTNPFTDSDKSKLDGISPNAQVNPTSTELKTLYGLNTNVEHFTTVEKDKLANIDSNAEKNRTDAEVKISYENNPDTNPFTDAYKSKVDSLNTSGETAIDVKTKYESNADTNVFDDTTKNKVDSIETGAQVNRSNSELKVDYESNSDTNPYTDSAKVKVDGIEPGAQVNPTPAEVKSSYESNPNTENFSTSEKSKLSTVGTGAEKNRTASELKTDYESNINTNAFEDSEKAKLSGIQTGAQVNRSNVQLKADYESNVNTNEYSDAEKSKVASVESGAQVNLNAGQLKSEYESNSDTNNFSDAEKLKLASLEESKFQGTFLTLSALISANGTPPEGAYGYVDPGAGSKVATYIWDSSDAVYIEQEGEATAETPVSVATKYESNADVNRYNNADKQKVENIEAGAEVNPTQEEIKIAYELNDDTNNFTNFEKDKLSRVNVDAEVNQSPEEIKAQYESNLNTNAFTDTYKSEVDFNSTQRHTHSKLSTLESINSEGSGNIITDDERTKLNTLSKSDKVLFISTTGYRDYDTIKEGLDSITDNTSSNRYTLLLGPGTLIVDNSSGPIQLKSFVNLQAIGDKMTVLTPAVPTTDMFIGANFAHILGVIFTGNTGTSYTLRHNVAGDCIILNCVLKDTSNGFIVDNEDSILTVRFIAVNNVAASTTDNVVNVIQGFAEVDGLNCRAGSKINTVISAAGNTSTVKLHNHLYTSFDITTGIYCNGAKLIANSLHIENLTDGIIVTGSNSNIRIAGSSIYNVTNDGLRVENVGTGLKVAIFSSEIYNCTRYTFNVLNPNTVLYGQGYTDVNSVNAVKDAKFYATLIDLAKNDEGTNIFGELKVGTPLNPAEAVIGGGDSYTRGRLVYFWDNINDIWSNLSDDLVDPSTDIQFPDITSDSALYFTSAITTGIDALKHYGIKLLVSNVGDIGTGTTIWEYWNGVEWEELHYMVRRADGDYQAYAKEVFADVGNFQIRLDPEVVNSSTSDWALSDPMALGVDLYWTRLRIVSDLNTSPSINQIKMHANNVQLNEDGFTTFTGAARPLGTLSWRISDAVAWSSSPSNQDIFFLDSGDGNTYDIGVGRVENLFASGATDKMGFSEPVPLDMDTSAPVLIDIYFAVDNNGSGDINYITSKNISGLLDSVGFNAGTAPDDARNYEITNSLYTVASDTNYKLLYLQLKIYYSEAVSQKTLNDSSDLLNFTFGRVGGSTVDNYGGDMAIVQFRARYYKWSIGGHVK